MGADGGDAALLASYLRAEYAIVHGGTRLVLRIGERVDDAMPAASAGHVHGLLTACNPASRRLPDEENRERMDRLHQALMRRGVAAVPAESADIDGGWREPSFWLPDVAVDQLDALAHEFGQNASLAVGADGVVRLRLYRDDWRVLAAGDERLQWPG